MPSELGTGLLHTGETYFLRGPDAAWWARRKPIPVIFYAHGATGTTGSVISGPEAPIIKAASANHLVIVGDWGGDTYANDTKIARILEGLTVIEGLNVDAERIGLVGMSMGAGGLLAFTRAHPDRVKYVAGLIPMLDINDVVTNNRGGLASAVNAAYGGTYSDSTHGPTHSPVRFATTLPGDLPIKLWTSTNDTYAVPSTADEFVTLRGQTERASLGAVGHSTAVVTSGVAAEVVAFCNAHR